MKPDRIFLKGPRIRKFQLLQHALIPRSRHFSPLENRQGFDLVNQLLAQRSSLDHLRLALFINLILISPWFFFGKPFSRLSGDQLQSHLERFFNCQIGLFRKGFWGLNTLAKCSFYGQAGFYDELGYRVSEVPND